MSNTPTSTPGSPTTPPARPPASALSPEEQQFVASLRQGSARKGIAVPDNFQAAVGGYNVAEGAVSTPRSVPTRYFEGDQLTPAGWDPARILQLQLQLKEAGIIPKNQRYQPGQWDQVSQNAYTEVLGYANQSGRTSSEVIESWKNYKPAEDEQPSVTLTLKNPENIKSYLKSVSGKIIGRSLTQAELNNLVEGYQNIDRAAQEAEAAAKQIASTTPGTKNEFVQPITLENYAEQQLREQNPGQADFVTAQGRMNDFFSILGEWNPNTGTGG